MMLSKLFKLIPDSVLNKVYDATFDELKKRGHIVFFDDCEDTYSSDYCGFTIELVAIPDETATVVWRVAKGDDIIAECGDDICSTMGESETSARKWIDKYLSGGCE